MSPPCRTTRQCDRCSKTISKSNWAKHQKRCKGYLVRRKSSKETSRDHYHRNREAILLRRKEQKAAKELKLKEQKEAEENRIREQKAEENRIREQKTIEELKIQQQKAARLFQRFQGECFDSKVNAHSDCN